VDATGSLVGVSASAKPGTDATGLRADAGKIAVSATSFDDRAVVARGLKIGVEGIGSGGATSIGVRGASGTGVRAEGIGAAGVGIEATGAKTAVKATSTSGSGVEATSANGAGVFATGNGEFGIGVLAAGNDVGVQGNGVNVGVSARSFGGTGLSASSSKGLGAEFQGGQGQAPVRLVPATTSGAPTTGTHHRGELYVDSQGQLFLCTADSAAGNAGTWRHVHLD
jgi:hypothetical protein